MNMERELFQGDAQDYTHKRSLRTGAPLRPAAGKPHIRLHYAPGSPVWPDEPWYAAVSCGRGGVVLSSTPLCRGSARAVELARRLI